MHAHLCEHKDEVSFCLKNYQKRPAAFLDEMGMVGENFLTAHNVVLSEGDITLLVEKGVKIVHCPRANLSNHGFPKTPRILECGGSVGMGSDGACSSSLSLFDEMKVMLSLIHILCPAGPRPPRRSPGSPAAPPARSPSGWPLSPAGATPSTPAPR